MGFEPRGTKLDALQPAARDIARARARGSGPAPRSPLPLPQDGEDRSWKGHGGLRLPHRAARGLLGWLLLARVPTPRDLAQDEQSVVGSKTPGKCATGPTAAPRSPQWRMARNPCLDARSGGARGPKSRTRSRVWHRAAISFSPARALTRRATPLPGVRRLGQTNVPRPPPRSGCLGASSSRNDPQPLRRQSVQGHLSAPEREVPQRLDSGTRRVWSFLALVVFHECTYGVP